MTCNSEYNANAMQIAVILYCLGNKMGNLKLYCTEHVQSIDFWSLVSWIWQCETWGCKRVDGILLSPVYGFYIMPSY